MVVAYGVSYQSSSRLFNIDAGDDVVDDRPAVWMEVIRVVHLYPAVPHRSTIQDPHRAHVRSLVQVLRSRGIRDPRRRKVTPTR